MMNTSFKNFTNFLAASGKKRQLRKAARQLHQLDDRELNDLGLGRKDIEYAVRFGRPGVDGDK